MKIEYAKPLTKEEKDRFFGRLKYFHDNLKESCGQVISSMAEVLIEKYRETDAIISIEYDDIKNKYDLDLRTIGTDKCACGSGLKYLRNYGFYGCVNYAFKGYHKNYKNEDGTYRSPHKRVPSQAKSYLSDIIKSLGLNGKLNAKSLHAFYTCSGLEDLKLKYSGEPYDKLINQYSEVKKIAKEFEEDCYQRVLPLYTNVLKEFGIKYKLQGEEERYCFLDLLCSNEKVLHIFECKTTKLDIDQNQNELYLSLINFMDKSGRDISLVNLTDKDRCGFETIDQREMWLRNGNYFGYPDCCIDSFLNKKANPNQMILNMNTGFTPCIECSKKVVRPMDLEKLISNRQCDFEFPFDSIWYQEIYPKERPDYFLNLPHDHIRN